MENRKIIVQKKIQLKSFINKIKEDNKLNEYLIIKIFKKKYLS